MILTKGFWLLQREALKTAQSSLSIDSGILWVRRECPNNEIKSLFQFKQRVEPHRYPEYHLHILSVNNYYVRLVIQMKSKRNEEIRCRLAMEMALHKLLSQYTR